MPCPSQQQPTQNNITQQPQKPTQNTVDTYHDTTKPRKTEIALFAENIPKCVWEILTHRWEEAFPGAKSKQLNRYVRPTFDEF